VTLLIFVLATTYVKVIRAVRRNNPTASLMLAYFFAGVVYNFTEAAFFRMMAPAWIGTLLAITKVPEVLSKRIPSLCFEGAQGKPPCQLV
jgi:hypothetical protein